MKLLEDFDFRNPWHFLGLLVVLFLLIPVVFPPLRVVLMWLIRPDPTDVVLATFVITFVVLARLGLGFRDLLTSRQERREGGLDSAREAEAAYHQMSDLIIDWSEADVESAKLAVTGSVADPDVQAELHRKIHKAVDIFHQAVRRYHDLPRSAIQGKGTQSWGLLDYGRAKNLAEDCKKTLTELQEAHRLLDEVWSEVGR